MPSELQRRHARFGGEEAHAEHARKNRAGGGARVTRCDFGRACHAGAMTMRPWMWLTLATGCGQMYQAPGGQPPPPAPAPVAAAPAPSAMPDPPDTMAPTAAPADPYGATPATA